jgi:lipoprotein-releasing system permease protein
MRLDLEIALRFLHRRGGRLLRGTGLAALIGVTVASASLVITMALMSGYSEAIASALRRGHAHMVAFSPTPLGLEQAGRLAAAAARAPGVRRASPMRYLVALAVDPAEPASPLPIVLKAVQDPPEFTGLEAWPEPADASSPQTSRPLPGIVGAKLAARLGVHEGSQLQVLLPPDPGRLQLSGLTLRCAGEFRLGFAQFDESWVVVPLGPLARAMPGSGAAGIEIELDDPFAVDAARAQVEAALPDLIVTDWREANRVLFDLLRVQTMVLFIMLSLVIAVASFQVSSSLVVLAIDKRRASGTLLALGATPRRVLRILVLAGSMLGMCGIGAGVGLGIVASLVATQLRLVRFPEGLAEVYMVDHIPFAVEPLHVLAVIGVGLLMVLGASLWPAWRAARLDPIKALKAV